MKSADDVLVDGLRFGFAMWPFPSPKTIVGATEFFHQRYPEIKKGSCIFELTDVPNGKWLKKLITVHMKINSNKSSKNTQSLPQQLSDDRGEGATPMAKSKTNFASGFVRIDNDTEFILGGQHAAKHFYTLYVGKIGKVVDLESGIYGTYVVQLHGWQFNNGKPCSLVVHGDDIKPVLLDVTNPDAPLENFDLFLQEQTISGRINIALDQMKENPEESIQMLQDIRPYLSANKVMKG